MTERQPRPRGVTKRTERELRHELSRRHDLAQQLEDLSTPRLARRYGVSPGYIRRLAHHVALNADPVALYRELQAALQEYRRETLAHSRGRDGRIRVKPMDTEMVTQDGFYGVVNRDTTVADIQVMVEG